MEWRCQVFIVCVPVGEISPALFLSCLPIYFIFILYHFLFNFLLCIAITRGPTTPLCDSMWMWQVLFIETLEVFLDPQCRYRIRDHRYLHPHLHQTRNINILFYKCHLCDHHPNPLTSILSDTNSHRVCRGRWLIILWTDLHHRLVTQSTEQTDSQANSIFCQQSWHTLLPQKVSFKWRVRPTVIFQYIGGYGGSSNRGKTLTICNPWHKNSLYPSVGGD